MIREGLVSGAAARGKYAPLYHHLSARSEAEWCTSFGEIEGILGFRLPNSARRYRGWWSNRGKDGGPCHALAWQAAGWRTGSIDLGAETLVFQRTVDVYARAGKSTRVRRFDIDEFWPPIRGGSWPPGFTIDREQLYDEYGRLTGGPQDDPEDDHRGGGRSSIPTS